MKAKQVVADDATAAEEIPLTTYLEGGEGAGSLGVEARHDNVLCPAPPGFLARTLQTAFSGTEGLRVYTQASGLATLPA